MTTTDSIQPNGRKGPLVTFVVACHNHDALVLRRCLESILSLSLSSADREVIVVDDGSDLCPMNDLMDMADSIVYVRKPEGGLSSARNLGITMAKGEFLQFVDADGSLVKFYYEHCLDVVRYNNPDMVMFGITNREVDERVGGMVDRKAMTGAEFMRSNNVSGKACGYIFRRDVLHNLRFSDHLMHEDEEFTSLLLLRCEQLYKLDVPAYFCHRRQPDAKRADKRWKLKRLDDTETIIKRLYRRADTLPHKERQAMQRRVAQLTMDYLRSIIILTRSKHLLEERIASLEREGLFPLPEKAYSRRYLMFAKMIKTTVGRNLLLMTLPIVGKGKLNIIT